MKGDKSGYPGEARRSIRLPDSDRAETTVFKFRLLRETNRLVPGEACHSIWFPDSDRAETTVFSMEIMKGDKSG